ncbi:hypothetical protein DS565_28050 [Salmonella enterica subsp. enterica serovar Bareilly]|nr:hypothetical protein [Salmonella enterica subsp. enterica serovar Bareilly]
MGFRLKIRRKQHFITITHQALRHNCVSDSGFHGQDIFETFFQFPNHAPQLNLRILNKDSQI